MSKSSTLCIAGAVLGAVALGTAGYSAGAAGLGRHTVGTSQLKPDSVLSAKVKDGSLRRADFAEGQLPPVTRVFDFALKSGEGSSPFHGDGITYQASCHATADGTTTAVLYFGLLDGDDTTNLEYTGNYVESVNGVSTLSPITADNEFQARAVAEGGEVTAATFDGIVTTLPVHTDLLIAKANSAFQTCSFRYAITRSDT